MNEQKLYSTKVRPYLQKLEAAGAPLWWRKTHGSAFQRDMLDILWSIDAAPANDWEEVGQTIFGAVELKNPDRPEPPTKGQQNEIKRMQKGGAIVLVSHNFDEVRTFFARTLMIGGWSHYLLTTPFL